MFESHLKPPITFPSVSGAICTFNSQYSGLPLKSHEVAITAIQSGSGTPSPDNPRPITGYSAINISHSDADTSNPTVYTITIDSTVYGGTFDAITGILTVTHKYFTTNTVYAKVNNGFRVTNVISDMLLDNTDGQLAHQILMSNCYTVSSINGVVSGTGNIISVSRTSGGVYIQNENITGMSVEDAQTYITDNPVEFVYELATPQTIQLPPCPIDTLLGENNIWADTGNTTLQYIKFG